MDYNPYTYQEKRLFNKDFTLLALLLFVMGLFEMIMIRYTSLIFLASNLFPSAYTATFESTIFYELSALAIISVYNSLMFWNKVQTLRYGLLGLHAFTLAIMALLYLMIQSSHPEYTLGTQYSNSVSGVSLFIIASLVPPYFNFVAITLIRHRVLDPVKNILLKRFGDGSIWRHNKGKSYTGAIKQMIEKY